MSKRHTKAERQAWWNALTPDEQSQWIDYWMAMKRFQRVGGTLPVRPDVLAAAASNSALDAEFAATVRG